MKRWNYYLFCVSTMVLMLLCAYWGSRVVTVISEELPFVRKHCIVIDPGHGGEDGGAVSCTGRMESEYNLAISRRLDDLLHLLGYRTRMTRTSDVSIYTTGSTLAQKKVSDLKERVRIVNETGNALLVSIHQNQFSDSRYSGAQVFYAKTAGRIWARSCKQNWLPHSIRAATERANLSAVYTFWKTSHAQAYWLNAVSCQILRKRQCCGTRTTRKSFAVYWRLRCINTFRTLDRTTQNWYNLR